MCFRDDHKIKQKKIKREKEGFYFLVFLVYAYDPTAVATNTAAKMATIADENSFMVGVGDGDTDGSVTELLVGTQMASMAAPLEVGVYVSELEVYSLVEVPCTTQHKNL